jgi:DNA repair protein RadC
VVLPRKIVETALKHHATTVIIAHNHPGGLPEPSDNDDAITQQIRNALQTVNISLQEHIIIADDGFYSYRQNGILG